MECSTSVARSSSGACSTSTGGVWAVRHQDRTHSSNDLIMGRLALENEDDAGPVPRAFLPMDELPRGGGGWEPRGSTMSPRSPTESLHR